jgi:hypothetical protein
MSRLLSSEMQPQPPRPLSSEQTNRPAPTNEVETTGPSSKEGPHRNTSVEKSNVESSDPPIPQITVPNRRGKDQIVPPETVELLKKALGNVDHDFFVHVLVQLVSVCSNDSGFDERQLKFMVSFIKDNKPTNQAHALLAVQMATVHLKMMSLSRTIVIGEDPRDLAFVGHIFVKLARTFQAQIESSERLRSNGEQKITVKNLSINKGAQAIVGNITQNAREGVAADPNTSPTNVRSASVPRYKGRQ